MLLRAFLTQALRDGFFHADMHPGNLFVDSDGRLVAVDFGIMGRLDSSDAAVHGRNPRRISHAATTSASPKCITPPGSFRAPNRSSCSPRPCAPSASPSSAVPRDDVSMARLLQQLFETTRRFDMQLQPQLVLLQKTMVVVEGVARSLDPAFDIWKASRPVVERWMVEQMGPQAQLRDAAEGVTALGRFARDLPQLLRNAEMVSAMLTDGGLRLHPDTARQIADAQIARTRHVRLALWIAAGALGVLALGALGLV